MLPGARFASRLRHLDQPMLRMRYRGGVVINAYGFPEWDLLARAMVSLPAPEPDLTIDEIRVLDVLTANELMILAGDPLWTFTADDYAPLTPPGWTWAHVPMSRDLALVPIELHGAFRHPGGAALLRWGRTRRGVAVDDATPVPMDYGEALSDGLVDRLEQHLGFPLPDAYQIFLARTNGAVPTTPGIHPDLGFVVDQPFFGLSRQDRHQDLVYANQWFADRLTRDFLAIGYVQGGLLAVKVTNPDRGSIWYWDDDDYRDDDRYSPEDIRTKLLYRCGDNFDAFWNALVVAPRRLLDLVDWHAASGQAAVIHPPEMGASLPPGRRAPN
jgi:HNH/ENDO VII superfamily nuclease/SMI1/KNR4 family protein SUKH-1